MLIPDKFTQFALPADLTQIQEISNSNTAQEMNCVRIGVIQEFYPENLTAQVRLVDKMLTGLNPDGSQILKEYPPIYVKVCYCNPFCTFPLTQGMECVLLFNDRELETWFINGGSNIQAYPRMHDLTDAIAIVGIRSLPQMIQILTDCLHLFYGQSDIQIYNENIKINTSTLNITGNTAQTGDTNQTGTITATNINATAAASGNIVDSQGKTLATVTNGIITSISKK